MCLVYAPPEKAQYPAVLITQASLTVLLACSVSGVLMKQPPVKASLATRS